MNINQHFNQLVAQAAEADRGTSELLSQRDRLFKDNIIPALVKRGANDADIVNARTKWNQQTEKQMQSAGLLPKPGQSSRSFEKDKRSERAIKKSVETGSKWPIIKESIISTGEQIGNIFGQGVGSMIEGAAGFVRDIGENEQDSIAANLANYGKNLRKGYEDSASTIQKEIQSGEHGKIPQLASGAIQSTPAMALPFGAAWGARAAAAKMGATASAPYIGLGVGAAAGHTQNYGEVRRNATANLERDFPTWEQLQGNPVYEQEFQKALDAGVQIDQARKQAHATALDQLSENAADVYGTAMTGLEFIAPSGAVLGSGILKKAPNSKISQALAGGKVNQALVSKHLNNAPKGVSGLIDTSLTANMAAAKMVGKQALEEGLQGAIGQYGAQSASANIGGQAVNWGDVGSAFLEEAVVGGVMGGGMQSASRATPNDQAKDVATQLRNQTNRLRQEEAQARQELSEATQLGNPDAIADAQANLNNIGAEALKVKEAYTQYGQEVPYFVDRFAAQYQPKVQPQAAQQPPEMVEPMQQPQEEQPAAPSNSGPDRQMASTTNLVMKAVSHGVISVDEANAIQSDPLRGQVFDLSVNGDKASAHGLVMQAVSGGQIDPVQAQDLIASIDHYASLGQPAKPKLSSIVDNHVKSQIQPQDDIFGNAIQLDSDFEPVTPGAPSFSEHLAGNPDFSQPKIFSNPSKANQYIQANKLQGTHEAVDLGDGTITVRPVQPQGGPELTDFGYGDNLDSAESNLADGLPEVIAPVENSEPQGIIEDRPKANFEKPKVFNNYVLANYHIKENKLKDTHEIVKLDDGRAEVRPKSVASIEDFGSDQAFDDMLNAVPPIGTPAQNPVEPVQAADPATDFDSDEALDELLSAVPPSGKQTDPVQPTASFADQIRDAHLNNPKSKAKLINDEVAKGRPRHEVLAEVQDVVKGLSGQPQNNAPVTPVTPESVVITPEQTNATPERKPKKEQKIDGNGIQKNDAPEGMKSGDIGRKSDNQPFANKSAATKTLKNQGLENSHEVVQLAPSSFVLRQKNQAEPLNKSLVEKYGENNIIRDGNAFTVKGEPEAIITIEGEKAVLSMDGETLRSGYDLTDADKTVNYFSDFIQSSRSRNALRSAQKTAEEAEKLNAVKPKPEVEKKPDNSSGIDELKRLQMEAEALLKNPKPAEDPATETNAEPVEAEKQTDHPYQKYDDLAKQYGRSVRPDGAILKGNGQDTNVRISEKKGRLRIEDTTGKTLFTGATNPESLGKFLEDYWYDTKSKPKPEPTTQEEPKQAPPADDIGRASDNAPFANEGAANIALRKKGLEDTHAVVRIAPSQFVLRDKSQVQHTSTPIDLSDPVKLVESLIADGRKVFDSGEPIKQGHEVVFTYKGTSGYAHLGIDLQENDINKIVSKLDRRIVMSDPYLSGGSKNLGSNVSFKYKYGLRNSGVKKLVISPMKNGDIKITATVDSDSKKMTRLKLVEDTQEVPKAPTATPEQTPAKDPLSFPLDKVKEAYGHAHLSPGNTAKSFKESFDKFIQAEIDEAQPLATTDEQKAALNEAIDWVKDNYINKALPPLLNAASATVSSARAGRNNFNSKQANQRGSALDKATDQFNAELERLKGYAKLKVLAARTPKQKQADAEAAAKAEQEKLEAEQAKQEVKIKAEQEAKANKKRASNANLGNPEGAEQMTAAEWRAKHKDSKSVIDGVRYVMKLVNGATSLVPVWITDEKGIAASTSKDPLQAGNTLTFSQDFDYATANKPYTIITSSKAKLTIEHEGGRLSIDRKILDIESAKNPDLYQVEVNQPAPKTKEETPAANSYESVKQSFDDVVSRLDDGDESLTLDDVKAAYKALMDNHDSLVAELSSQTKSQLLEKMHPYYAAMYKSHKKDELVNKWVNNTYRGMDFGSNGVVTISYGDKRTMAEIVRDKIEAATQEDLNKYLEERRQAVAEHQKDLEAAEAGMNDPKTLDDFRRINAKGDFKNFKEFYRSLTVPQQALYDELRSAETNEARMQEIERNKAYREASRPSQAVESTTEATLFAGKHTKKGTDIWTVALNGRVDGDAFNDYRSQAKGLGGYYSSYKGGGAVPGFIFDNEAAANEFLNLVTGDHEANSTDPEPEAIAIDPEAEVEVIETDAKRQADKLREKAQAIIERGEQNINRERKTNTAKRAGEAARAEEQANKAIFLGETLNRVADGIENGTVKYLSRLGAMTQLGLLESLLQRASYDQQRETNAKEREINATTIAYVEYPQYKTWIDSFKDIRHDLRAANPRLADKLEKAISTRYHNAYSRWLNETNEFGTENYVGQLARKVDGTPAVFKTNIKQAESLVKSVNKKAGKEAFVVFKIKNGEYAVISSYETAMENGSWKPTNSDKKMTLTNEFGHELYNALKQYKRKNPSYYMSWFIESMNESVSRMEKLGIHDPATFRAAMREYLGLRSKEKANDPIKELERSMVGRTNDGLDFFPTPRNVVEQMIEMADLDSDMKVLEPSAGMGHIADVLKDHGIQPDVIELSDKRQELLRLKGYNVVGNDFLTFDPKNRAPNYGDVFKTADGKYQGIMRGSGSLGSSRVRLMREDDGQMITYFDRDELELVKMNGVNYDRIIMNPPFSDRRDAAHIYHAFDLLADDGVMVAIAGEGVFFGKDKAAKEFQEWLDNVGAEVTPLDAGTFNDPSLPVTTGVKARIIKISKADSKGKLFSRSENLNQAPEHAQNKPSGSTPDQVRAELKKRFGDDVIQQLEDSGLLIIEQTYSEPGVEGFAENGRVTLIADAITAENIVPVFLHELGGHIGLQGVLAPQAYENLMKDFNRLVAARDPTALEAKRLAERESNAEVQADEYLPYLITVAAQQQAKQGPVKRLVNRIVSAVKAWAVDKLGVNLQLNANDILALAERMVKQVPKHTPPTGPKGGRRYSRSSNPQNMSRSRQREFFESASQTALGEMALRNMERGKTLSRRTLNLFQTMLHKALTDESGQFKKTFDLVQGKINHVTFMSSKSMDAAPSVLTQLEEGSDYWKEAKRVGKTLAHKGTFGKVDKAKIDTDLDKVGKVLFENTLTENSERHTEKELRQLGFDQDQIDLYMEIRESIDTSLDTFANTTFSNIYKHLGGTTEEVLELAGRNLDITDHYNEVLKMIDKLTKGKPEKADARQAAIEAIDRVYKKANDLKDQGYVPLMRFGKYFVRIYNPTTGDVAYRQHFESESERNMYFREREKQKDSLPAGFVVEKGQINELQHKLFQGISPETVALFAQESGLPIGDAETAYIKYAVQNNHALKRLLKRQGIDGFDTDIKRVLASFVLSNARYSANQTYNPAIDESITEIEDAAYQEDAIRLRDYALDTQEELSGLKNFAFVWYMGFSVMFGLVNLTQPLLQTFPYLMQYSKEYGVTGTAFLKAINTWRKGADHIEDKYKVHYEKARKEGHLDPQNTWMLQGLERGKSGLGASVWQLISHSSGMFAQASETVNRRTTLFAALDVAESLGPQKLKDLGFKDAYDFAVRAIQETQGIYNKGNRPRVSRGNVGSMLMMYKQFMIAYIEQMARMQKSGLFGGEDDEFKKNMAKLIGFGISRPVLIALGILMSLSGATGLPFVRDILDGVETVGGMIGKPVNTEREVQIALHNALGATLGGAVNTALMDGFVNLQPIVDVKGRMGMGDLIPATAYFSPTTSDYQKGSEAFSLLGSMGGLVEKANEAVQLAKIGAYGQAGVQLLPKAATSLGQGGIAAVTGDYRNMKTGVKTNEATVLDGVVKMLDAQPSRIAKEGRVRGLEMRDRSVQQYVNARWRERYEEALSSGDTQAIREIKQQIRDYNATDPRYPVTFNQKRAETNHKKANQKWQDKRKNTTGLEWMDQYNPYIE